MHTSLRRQPNLYARLSIVACMIALPVTTAPAQDAPPTPAELKAELLVVPDGADRITLAFEIAEMTIAAAEDASKAAAQLDAVIEVLSESKPLEPGESVLLVEEIGRNFDCAFLAMSVLSRAADMAHWEQLCEARWRLIAWRHAALNTFALAGTTAEEQDRRFAARLRNVLKVIRSFIETAPLIQVDLNDLTDSASLSQALGRSAPAKQALWTLAMSYVLAEEVSDVAKAITQSGAQYPESMALLQLLKTERVKLDKAVGLLGDKCRTLKELIRSSHLTGVVHPTLDTNKTKLTLVSLRLLTNGWHLGLNDVTELQPDQGVELEFENTQPLEQLVVLASTEADVEVVVSVVHRSTDQGDAARGDGGWGELSVDAPSIGPIQIRVFNMGSVPASIRTKVFLKPRQ